MKTLKDSGKIAVDSNIIISALLRGKAFAILEALRDEVLFLTTSFNISEIGRYIPFISDKLGIRQRVVEVTLSSMPLIIRTDRYYRSSLAKANKLIGNRDDSDIHLLALALRMGIAVWTNDKDFSSAGITVYGTADMVNELRRRT